MKNRTVILSLIVVVGLAAAGEVIAQTQLIRASRLVLIGAEIRSLKGEDLGTVEDLLVDMESGEVRYVVITAEDHDRLMAIPVEAFKVDGNSGALVLDADREFLRKAPSFERNEWPDMTEGGWTQTVRAYYYNG